MKILLGVRGYSLSTKIMETRYLVALAFALLMLVSACGRGAYPIELFPEMHYTQSFKEGEPDRLSPPSGSVPWEGMGFAAVYVPPASDSIVKHMDFYKAFTNPDPGIYDSQVGGELFRVNCSMCHGSKGAGGATTANGDAGGQGKVGFQLQEHGYSLPPSLLEDLGSKNPVSKTDGELFGTITHGAYVMPKFGNLLTQEERWQIVGYLRELQTRS
jgi:mono/diheme cytochrome c family protein